MTFPTLSELEDLARQAGEILRAGYSKEHQVSYKGVIDLVTEIDRALRRFSAGRDQQTLAGKLHPVRRKRHHAGRSGTQLVRGSTGRHGQLCPWYPFLLRLDRVCLRRACMQLGAVYDPLRDEMFSAERGQEPGSTATRSMPPA